MRASIRRSAPHALGLLDVARADAHELRGVGGGLTRNERISALFWRAALRAFQLQQRQDFERERPAGLRIGGGPTAV